MSPTELPITEQTETQRPSWFSRVRTMFNPHSKRGGLLLFMVVFVFLGGSYLLFKSFAATPYLRSSAGTYSYWKFPDNQAGYNSLEWTFTPLKDPAPSLSTDELLHFYAYNFSVINKTGAVGSGYAGFQTDGHWHGVRKGKVINFSIWGSNGGYTPNSGTLVNPNNSESDGWQLMLPFRWVEGHPYNFQLKQGTKPTDSLGKWWGLWVTDMTTNKTTYVGEQRVPTTIDGKPSDKLHNYTSMFGEDTHWWRTAANPPTVYKDCKSFENSALGASNITADNHIKPTTITTRTDSEQIHHTTFDGKDYTFLTCKVNVTRDNNGNVKHFLGYWGDTANKTLIFNAAQDSYTGYDMTYKHSNTTILGKLSKIDVNYLPAACRVPKTICDTRYRRRGYLKFAVAGLTGRVQSVHLYIYPTTSIIGTFSVYKASSNNWYEDSLLWSNQPNPLQPALAKYLTSHGNPTNSYIDIHLSNGAISKDGVYSFVLGTDTANVLSLGSKEGGHPPQLVVTYQ